MAMQEKRKTILVIEDDCSLLAAICDKIQKSGFETITARTVKQALDCLSAASRVDAIWLDHYLLGKENGIDFVEKVKCDGTKWKNIPIFVVSNTAGPDKVRSYIRLGILKYYIKAEKRLEDIITDIKMHI